MIKTKKKIPLPSLPMPMPCLFSVLLKLSIYTACQLPAPSPECQGELSRQDHSKQIQEQRVRKMDSF